MDEVGLKSLALQEGSQQICQFYVVVNDEDAHGFSVARALRSRFNH